jgi:hypothetical protein
MCRNFTYEVVEQRRRLKAIKKNCSSKLKVILEFFKYFFRVLHEASSSWLKFQKHPVYNIGKSFHLTVVLSAKTMHIPINGWRASFCAQRRTAAT